MSTPIMQSAAEAVGAAAPAPRAALASVTAPSDRSVPTAFRALPSAPLPVGPSPHSALQRVGTLSSRAVAEMSYQLQRLGTAALAGGAAIVLASIVLITGNLPQVSAVKALKTDLAATGPSAHGRLAAAPSSAALAALPSRADAPKVVEKILEEAQASGVELPRGQYEYVPARDGVAARYRMTFPVRATYPRIREFMDRTLVALPAVAIEGLRIERKNVGDDSVDAELKLSAFVRSEP